MAYVSLDELKDWSGITSTTKDVLVQACIDAAQSYFETQTGRVFEASADSTHYLDAVRDVSLDKMTLYMDGDVASFTTITNGDATVVSASSYVTEPRNSPPHYAVRLKTGVGLTWTYTTSPENAITVAGKWAYATAAPTDVAHAVKIIAAQLFSQKDNANDADRIVSVDGVVVIPSSIPKIAADVIRKYQRKEFK